MGSRLMGEQPNAEDGPFHLQLGYILLYFFLTHQQFSPYRSVFQILILTIIFRVLAIFCNYLGCSVFSTFLSLGLVAVVIGASQHSVAKTESRDKQSCGRAQLAL